MSTVDWTDDEAEADAHWDAAQTARFHDVMGTIGYDDEKMSKAQAVYILTGEHIVDHHGLDAELLELQEFESAMRERLGESYVP